VGVPFFCLFSGSKVQKVRCMDFTNIPSEINFEGFFVQSLLHGCPMRQTAFYADFFVGLPAGFSVWLCSGFAALSSPRGRTIFPASSTDLDCEQIFLKSMSYDSVSENRFLVA
jgi:hypothetical protein